MTDTIIKGSGNSRSIKFPPNAASMYQDLADFLTKGSTEGIPIDLGPLNPTGLNVRGTDLNKANLLSDETAKILGLGEDEATVDKALLAAAYLTTDLNWKMVTVPHNLNNKKDICYGAGRFIIVGNAANNATTLAITSTDGINWTEENLFPVSQLWTSITHGNGMFVAVGNTNVAVYSSDGVNWNTTTIPISDLKLIEYLNDRFIALPVSGNSVAYSLDGVNWDVSTIPVSTSWYSATYGKGIYIIVGGSRIAAYSTDGENWTGLTTPSYTLQRIAYGNGIFVLAGLSGNYAYSTDGLNWTTSQITDKPGIDDIVFGAGKFVTASTGAWLTYDGINWTRSNPGSNALALAITFGRGLFVALANGNLVYEAGTYRPEDVYTTDDLFSALLGTRSTK